MIQKVQNFLNRTVLKNTPKSVNIGGFSMLMNRDNMLAERLQKYPHYSQNFPRLVAYMHEHVADVKVIDIGANFGDTVAMVKSLADVDILCVEGNADFFALLSTNVRAHFPGVQLVNAFVGDDVKSVSKHIQTDTMGTSRLVASQKEHTEITTLDTILENNKPFDTARVLKIDTDGYDFAVIRGAKKYIEHVHPVIFMEYEREFLEGMNEDGLSIFRYLSSVGYSKIIFYDNYGRYVLMTDVSNESLIRDLYYYSNRKRSGIVYYDVVIFHTDDEQIAEKFSSAEFDIFHKKA